MPIPVNRLRVHPNPFIVGTVDHLGRPAGRVPYDPFEDAPRKLPDIGVGAKQTDVVVVAPAQSVRVGNQDFETSPARVDHRVSYSRVAVEIPNTPYYREAIQHGNLFAADRKTWTASGGSPNSFVEPKEALAKAREAAIGHFDASTGEDAHKEMGAHEPLWFGGEEPSAQKPAASAGKPNDAKGAV